MARRELEPASPSNPSGYVPPPPIKLPKAMQEYAMSRSTEMGDLEFSVYDLVRRICEADNELHQAHQTDVAFKALAEGLFTQKEGQSFYDVTSEVRATLNWLRSKGFIDLKAGTKNTFVLKRDLLTTMAARL